MNRERLEERRSFLKQFGATVGAAGLGAAGLGTANAAANAPIRIVPWGD